METPTTPVPPVTPALMKFADWQKFDLKVGNILEAKVHPKADKLLILQVRLGDETRQIVAGIKQFYECENLVGKQIVVVTNLEPRKMMGEMSNGMLLAASDGNNNLALISPEPLKDNVKIAAGSGVH